MAVFARRLRRALAAGAGALLALVLGELGLRAFGGVQADPQRVRAELERVVQPLRSAETAGEQAPGNETFLHPYTGYETANGLRDLLWQADYVRSQAASAASVPPYVIVVLGGSVAELFGAPGHGGAERLVEVLREDERFAEREVVVLNHGRPAFKQPQPLLHLVYLLQLGIQPDLVLLLDGFNEVGLGLYNAEAGVHPALPSTFHWRHLIEAERAATPAARAVWVAEEELRTWSRAALERGLWRSALGARWCSWRLGSARERLVRADAAYAAELAQSADSARIVGPAYPNEHAERLDLCVAGWERASRSMHALCAGLGIAFAHALQPTLADEGSKPRTPEEQAFLEREEEVTVVRGAREGYPLLRERGRALARDGVLFLDTSRVFAAVDAQVYDDLCHFERPWTPLLGEAIARQLLEGLPEAP